MQSYEVLRLAADEVGVKALAAKLNLSPALVYKWCQEWDSDNPDTSGARNPLDRVAEIVNVTGDPRVINWLCHQAGGFYSTNPTKPLAADLDTSLLINTQKLVNEFSNLLLEVTRSIEDDGEIEPKEAKRIRQSWETLKSFAETFTTACDEGHYYTQKD